MHLVGGQNPRVRSSGQEHLWQVGVALLAMAPLST